MTQQGKVISKNITLHVPHLVEVHCECKDVSWHTYMSLLIVEQGQTYFVPEVEICQGLLCVVEEL